MYYQYYILSPEKHTEISEYMDDRNQEIFVMCLLFQAIEVDPSNAVYYANRSIAYLRTECFGYALTDASKAIETDKTYLKECFYSVNFCQLKIKIYCLFGVLLPRYGFRFGN